MYVMEKQRKNKEKQGYVMSCIVMEVEIPRVCLAGREEQSSDESLQGEKDNYYFNIITWGSYRPKTETRTPYVSLSVNLNNLNMVFIYGVLLLLYRYIF